MTGVTKTEKVPVKGSKKSWTAASTSGFSGGAALAAAPVEDPECDLCRANVYLSWIRTDLDAIYCLQHGLKQINSNRLAADQCRLVFTYSVEEVEQLIGRIRSRTTGSPPTALQTSAASLAGSDIASGEHTSTMNSATAKSKKATKSTSKRKL